MRDAPGSPHPATLAVLASTPAALRGLLANQPASGLETPGAEGWSPKDVVAHMLSIESQALRERVRLIAEGDDPAIPNIGQITQLLRAPIEERRGAMRMFR